MSVREYIGARYVPLFADPIEWDNTKTYEPLTIVYYQGNSYTSRQAVPTGIAITNETYWALTGNYNAQIEAYREEVRQYNEEVAQYNGLIEALEDALPISSFDETDTVDARFDVIEADDWVTADRIADNAVTTDKIANSTITSAKISDGTIQTVDLADGIITSAKMEPKVWGFIGDSFSDPDYYNWVPTLQNYLGETICNKAKSGASFYNVNNSFLSQLQALKNENVKFTDIIIYGGVNDTSGTNLEISTAVGNFFNYLKSNFNWYPRVHMFIGNCPFFSGEEINRIVTTIRDTAIPNYKNLHWYPNINGWQIAHFGWSSANNIHPSDAFLTRLPKLMYQALMTGNTACSVAYKPTANPNTDAVIQQFSSLIATNTEIIIPGSKIQVTSAPVANPVFTYNLPGSFPSTWQCYQYEASVAGVGGVNVCATLQFNGHNAGTMSIWNATANTTYAFPDIVIPVPNG